MAFARFTADSDVYVYEDSRGGFTCERCPGIGHSFRCETVGEMVLHLLEHRSRGDRVPDEALQESRAESDSSS